MSAVPIDVTPLRRALATLAEALQFWQSQAEGSALKPHLRSSVIQSFEFSCELALRLLRRALIERALASSAVSDLSFNDLLRAGADAGLVANPEHWRVWRELRNATSRAYDEAKAQAVATEAAGFVADGRRLLAALEAELGR